MKLERNGIVAITFVVTFVILLLFSLLTSGFRIEIKGILVAIYFAVWVAAVVFVLLTFIIPFIKEKKDIVKSRKSESIPGAGIIQTPYKSPRSGLPIRERIASYVSERRREDGLSAPEPLRPSHAGSSVKSRVPQQTPRPMAGSASSATPGGMALASAPGDSNLDRDDLGDIPLPDDFGSIDDSSGDMGGLPGLDGDLGDLDGFGENDDLSPGFGGDEKGYLKESADDRGMPVSSPSSDGLPAGGLPDFDGNVEPDFDESDLMADDGMMDLTGDDVLTIDDDHSSPGQSSGVAIDAEIPDFEDTMDPDILDDDLSGDDDFGDIEFLDLESEEPKKSKK